MSTCICPCGETEPHEIARRTTFDGRTICLWSDGMLTARMGLYVAGIGRKRLPMDRLWEVANEAPLLTMDEVVEQFQIHHAIERRVKRTGTKHARRA
jgi:hypothetical protein